MDPYNILGVDRSATQEDIKNAYRRLANKHHPDRGGDTRKFQEIQAAYDAINDPQKRAQHDNPQHFGGFGPGFRHTSNPFDDFINQFFHQTRQKIYTVTVFVTLEQIAAGSIENVQINTPTGMKLIQLRIPANIEDGGQVRYEGIMPDGILQVQFRVHRHPTFTREGHDLHITTQVDIFQLIVGTKITVGDIYGKKIEVTIPAMTKPGTKFRLPGHGLGGIGDQYVLIDGKLPDKIGPDTLNQIKLEVQRNNNDQ